MAIELERMGKDKINSYCCYKYLLTHTKGVQAEYGDKKPINQTSSPVLFLLMFYKPNNKRSTKEVIRKVKVYLYTAMLMVNGGVAP